MNEPKRKCREACPGYTVFHYRHQSPELHYKPCIHGITLKQTHQEMTKEQLFAEYERLTGISIANDKGMARGAHGQPLE